MTIFDVCCMVESTWCGKKNILFANKACSSKPQYVTKLVKGNLLIFSRNFFFASATNVLDYRHHHTRCLFKTFPHYLWKKKTKNSEEKLFGVFNIFFFTQEKLPYKFIHCFPVEKENQKISLALVLLLNDRLFVLYMVYVYYAADGT